jgi:hypothetical protein
LSIDSSPAGLLHGCAGVVVGLKEALVQGDLVAAQAGLLVHDQLFDLGCEGDAAIEVLDLGHGGVAPVNLPDQHAGEDEAGDDRKDQHLAESLLESLKLQCVPFLLLGFRVLRSQSTGRTAVATGPCPRLTHST